MSENYAECIVKLFNNNKNCIAAGGAIKSIDSKGNDNHRHYQLPQTEYISGIDMLFSYIDNNAIYNGPGAFLSFDTNKLINIGGYDHIWDTSQLLRVAVLGDVGCDKQATFFFRHHENNSNIQFGEMGALYYKSYNEWFKDYKIYEFYKENYGDEIADKIIKFWKHQEEFQRIYYFAQNTINNGLVKNFTKSFKTINKECPHLIINWLIYVIYHILLKPKNYLMHIIRYVAKKFLSKRLYSYIKSQRNKEII